MTESHISYVGPLPRLEGPPPRRRNPLGVIPLSMVIIVGVPTLLAAVYYLLLASPRYVSEAQFVVRSASQDGPSSLGIALQGVGLSAAQSDTFAVHQYMTSRDALRDVGRRIDVPAILARPGADVFARHPRFWEGHTFEDLHKAFQRFLTVGYDSTDGISTIRVEAFRPEDAQKLADGLLVGGEQLVNRLNERAARDTVDQAERNVGEAETRLALAQQQLTSFRTREQLIDPTRTATEGSQMIGDLMSTLAGLRADRAQLAAGAPESPQLSMLDSRIRAYEQQVEAERAKLAGASDSLAPKIGAYESLVLDREIADRALTAATNALDFAHQDARRQRLYLERVVSPNLPDKPTAPHRWRALLAVFATTLLIYGVGWLIVAGVREHKQD